MIQDDGTTYLAFNVVDLKGACPMFGKLEDDDLRALRDEIWSQLGARPDRVHYVGTPPGPAIPG